MNNIKKTLIEQDSGNRLPCGRYVKSSNAPSIAPSIAPSETMQNLNIKTDWQKISQPWVPTPEPQQCSLIQANWSDPISKLSTDPTCFCPVGNKASTIINNTVKCQS